MHRKRLKMLPLTAAVLLAWAGTASALDFHGYFRSGAGASSKDGGMECFKLPGAQGNGNFRLGNECETYGEAQFDQNVYEGKGDGVKFDYHVMFGYAAPQNADFENLAAPDNHIALRQNYVDAKLPYLNGGDVWIGKRYYQRHDIHINDFFYWDVSGPGAGVEKFGLGDTMNTSFAYLRQNGNNAFGAAANDPNHDAATLLDWRLAGIPLFGLGQLEVGANYRLKDTKVPNSKDGWAISSEWAWNVLGGVNKLFGYYGKDALGTSGIYRPGNSQPGNQDQGWGIIDFLVYQFAPAFSGGIAIGHYDWKNNYKWDFAGVRPVWHLNDYFKLQGELGWNKVKAASQADSANLTKLTIAPTIVAGPGFWARPELRFYYSYNKWSNKARDGVFGPGNGVIAGGTAGPFGADTNGATWGFQAEAWW